MPMADCLHGNASCPGSDRQRIGQPVEPVDEQNDLRCLRRRAGAARAHRHADACRRQRGRIVHPVAHHDADALRACRRDRGELVLRPLLRPDLVHAERRPDCLRDVTTVAGEHDDAGDPRPAQQSQRPRGIRTDLVGHEQRTQHFAVRRHERPGRPLVAHPPQEPMTPGGSSGASGDIGVAADRDPAAFDRAGDAGSRFLLHVGRHGECEPAVARGLDDRRGDDVLGVLVEAGTQAQHFVVRHAWCRLDRDDRGRHTICTKLYAKPPGP
jgi:hypothetical protein